MERPESFASLRMHGLLLPSYRVNCYVDPTMNVLSNANPVSCVRLDRFATVPRSSGWALLLLLFVGFLIVSAGCNRSQPYLVASPSGFLGAGSSSGASPTVPAANAPGTAASGTAALGPNAYAAQMAELERRAKLLDENNRQLHTQLAQSQQQMQLYKERSDLMQRQLSDMSGQLQQAKIASSRPMPPTSSSAAPSPLSKSTATDSTRRSGARLTANTSGGVTPDGLKSLGYEVEVKNGVVRLRIPSDQLFQSGSAQPTTSAAGILDRVAEVIRTDYPKQRIAIEGHTDNAPLYGGTYSTSHQLASAQTNAVFEHLTKRNQIPQAQLFTLAHGSNYPLMDNQTPAGRASNRRIEFVIYTETY